ncbi:MAG: SsrA-binding protein SmpB [Acidimicrobiia bacterium]
MNPRPSPRATGAGNAPTLNNRKARHNYAILDTYECGIVLQGSEVKSIREGQATLADAYARVEDGEVWLFGMHVTPYSYARGDDLEPLRRRKLLLHHKEIDRISRATDEKGVTLVPLRLYFKDGRAKVELAVARGKRAYDKRHAIAERDALRDADRAMKERNRE